MAKHSKDVVEEDVATRRVKKGPSKALAKATKALAKATKLIQTYEAKREERRATDGSQPQDLTDENQTPFYLQFALTGCVDRAERKPTLVPLPFPPRNIELAEVCLIVRNPQRFWKDKLEAEKSELGMIKRVIDFEHLIKKYPTHQDKRELLSSYDLFLADKKLMHLIPSHLGCLFRKSTKMPLGIDLPEEEPLAASVLPALRLTPILMRPGSTVSVRVGDRSMSSEALVANAACVMEAFKGKLARMEGDGWGVSHTQLHLSQSISVPLP